ncbi:MAG: 3D domain-containing protein [Acidobacteriota bacterium]
MLITNSLWRKIVATIGAAVGMVFLYETTTLDSRYAARNALVAEATALPQAGTELEFSATAYCKGQITASGASVRTGMAAADPQLLPVGTVVRLETSYSKLDGIWTIMDTGPAVQGRIIDLYLWSCHEALEFGRRQAKVTVLRLGWNPQHSAPSLIDRLFSRREAARVPPSRTYPDAVPAMVP